ncbi:Mechanosensitive ion channel-domain-containing protein [Cristinia sonorae]|uniref:Mechanosensitive ion channel-domain-containing protein n=1 Tax=Cristinia sonorae TaxID=1940300 RepID=A0A8K0UXY3_9AGAR|nr:Mechanosensitive ion channel-domain-containing protein [Cristinia sonorae]
MPEKTRLEDTDTKKTVRYDDGVYSPPITERPPPIGRFDTFDSSPGSRSPSIAGTDEETDDEDYDWSGEDDLLDEEAKFEHAMGIKKKKSGWGLKRIFGLLFSSLIGSTILSGIIVTPAILVHFYWYKPHPTDQRRYVRDNIDAWLFWAASNVSVSWFLALLVDIVPTFIRYFIMISWGHVSESIKNKLEMYHSVKDTIKPLFYAAASWVSWVILFQFIFKLYDADDEDASRASYTPRVYQAIEFLFFLALVWCAQRMLSHAIAFAFHRTAFRERLETLNEALKTIEKLRLYRPKRPARSSGFGRATPSLSAAFGLSPFVEKEHFTFSSRQATPANSRPATPDRLQELVSGNEGDYEDPDATLVGKKGKKKGKGKGKNKQKGLKSPVESDHTSPTSGSPHVYPPTNSNDSPLRTGANTPTRRAPSDESENVVTHAAHLLKAAVLHDARNIQGRVDENLGGLVWNVTSSHEAKRLARSIYTAFKDRRRTYLVPSDFYPAFKTHEEAEQAFRVFDKDNNGDISRAEIKTVLMKVYKERRSLSRSMRDVSAAMKTLDHILLFFAAVVLFFISLSVFRVSVGDSLTSVYSLGIAASFIFKNSASNAFDAIMFLFVTHPFDTGDRCFIDEENLVVKKMGLFATVFTRADGTETYYFNSLLFTKFITNLRRSDKMSENLSMQVAWRTPLEKLDALEKCLNDWLATEENRWFQPSTSVTLQKINFQRHLEITIGIGHNANWQDWGLRQARKTAFHAAVNYFCRQLGIVAYQSPMPITFADQDTLEWAPGSPTPYDDEYERDESEFPLPQPTMHGAVGQTGQKTVWLGFMPPSDKPIPGALRARKSKSRKAMLRTLGADG